MPEAVATPLTRIIPQVHGPSAITRLYANALVENGKIQLLENALKHETSTDDEFRKPYYAEISVLLLTFPYK